MTVGATVFALGHARPVGPIGMALFLAGVIWLDGARAIQTADYLGVERTPSV